MLVSCSRCVNLFAIFSWCGMSGRFLHRFFFLTFSTLNWLWFQQELWWLQWQTPWVLHCCSFSNNDTKHFGLPCMLLDFASHPPSLENWISNDPCLRFEIFIVHLLLMICYCIFKMFIFKIYCRFLDVIKLGESIIEDCACELYFHGLMNSRFYTSGNFFPHPHPDSTCKCRWNRERDHQQPAMDI